MCESEDNCKSNVRDSVTMCESPLNLIMNICYLTQMGRERLREGREEERKEVKKSQQSREFYIGEDLGIWETSKSRFGSV